MTTAKCGCLYLGAVQMCKVHAAAPKLLDAIKRALEAFDRHDNADFACESVEGAEGASDAREILEEAVKIGEVKP